LISHRCSQHLHTLHNSFDVLSNFISELIIFFRYQAIRLSNFQWISIAHVQHTVGLSVVYFPVVLCCCYSPLAYSLFQDIPFSNMYYQYVRDSSIQRPAEKDWGNPISLYSNEPLFDCKSFFILVV